MNKITFSTILWSGDSAAEVLLWVHSLRAHGGQLSASQVLLMLPEAVDLPNEAIKAALESANVLLERFNVPSEILRFPYAAKIYAGAAAESLCADETAVLVWMDPDTIILHEPTELMLLPRFDLACCPVHLKNISAGINHPPERFWQLIYDTCGIQAETLIPMTTTVDNELIRPQMTAGLLSFRPGLRLMRRWKQRFLEIYQTESMRQDYQRNVLYKIYIHQAVLTGVLLAGVDTSRRLMLPSRFNYPVFLHPRVVPQKRLARLNDAVTLRYDEFAFFNQPGWLDIMPVEDPILSWLDEQVSQINALIGGINHG